MNLRQLGAHAVVAFVSAIAGVWLTEPEPAAVAAAAAAPPAIVPAGSAQQSPTLISVEGNGTVTLRVEQMPLDWVLEQIGKQSGRSDLSQRVGAARPSVAAALVPDPKAAGCAPVPPPAATVLQAIASGSDDERYESLLRARADGVSLTDDALKRLYLNDASDRVRTLAFQRFLEQHSASFDDMREALEAGLAVPNEAVRAEARGRLDSLLNGEGVDSSIQ
jgi:hypothetical protein